MTKEYRIDYTVTAYGRSRSTIKTFRAYCWSDAVRRLRDHAQKKWVDEIGLRINGATVNGELINPDLLDAA